MKQDDAEKVQRASAPETQKSSALSAVGTVLSAFIGIRRGKASREDLAKLKPAQIIVTAVICAGILIGSLILLVKHIAS